MQRKERIDYKWREDGSIRAFDILKGTNITEMQIWIPEAVCPSLLTETVPHVILRVNNSDGQKGIRQQDKPHSFTLHLPCVWQMGFGRSRPIGPYPGQISPSITSSRWEDNNVLIYESNTPLH